MSIQLKPIDAHDREPLARMLARIPQFKPDEVAVAMELVDASIADPHSSGYESIVALDAAFELCGYICFGPTPMTRATWDLYWIAVAQERQGLGIGKRLYGEFARTVAARGGAQVRIETSSQELYAATGGFYERLGFVVAGRLTDFYAPGDDLLLFYRTLL